MPAALGFDLLAASPRADDRAGKQPPRPAAKSLDFDRDVAPILARRCLDCHNPAEHKGGLVLSTAATALAGGDSGPVIVPGKADESLLCQRIDKEAMPPKK